MYKHTHTHATKIGWFPDFIRLSNIDTFAPDVSAEVAVLSAQHCSTIHFSWEKRSKPIDLKQGSWIPKLLGS